MVNLLNIEILENEKGGHEDLIFEIPNLISQQKLDTYYFALAIEPKSGLKEIKKAVSKLLESWNKKRLVTIYNYNYNRFD